MASVTQVDEGLHCIDLEFQGRPGVIASYLLEDSGERALIESGPGSTIPALVAGLDHLGVDPHSIGKLLVTHIHLDHAGAAGELVQRFPGMQILVHEIGAPHLITPDKLIASATRVYGNQMGLLWGDILPAPPERVTAISDGDFITVGARRLDVLYTPGHASHHVAYHDVSQSGVFTGDVAAVRLQGESFVRPPTPPPDINLEAWSRSLTRIRDLHPRALRLTHFGQFQDVDRHLDDSEARLYAWADLVQRAEASGQNRLELVDALQRHGDGELLQETNDAETVFRYDLATPYGMTVDGYLRYFQKQATARSG